MAIVGLKKIKLALVDPITQQILSGKDGLSESGIYEVDDEKSEAVKTIYRQFLSGQSLYEISNYLNKNYPHLLLHR